VFQLPAIPTEALDPDDQKQRSGAKATIVVAASSTMLSTRMSKYLQSLYEVHAFATLDTAISACRRLQPAVVVIGEELRGGNGFELVRLIRMDKALRQSQTIMILAKDDKPTRDSVSQSGIGQFLLQSCSQPELLAVVARRINQNVQDGWAMLPLTQRRALTSTVTLFNTISDVIAKGEPIPFSAANAACKPLVEAVSNNDFKGILTGVRHHDDYSYAHSLRVATLLALFGFNLGLSKDEQGLLATGGLLHDVGKMMIPREVLNKPGRLTEAEFKIMQGHVDASVTYLEACGNLPAGIITIAAQHHEKLDGSGYPEGLAGTQLDTLARMASIIDVFSALTDRRVYKPPMEPEKALALMTEQMASHLDMKLLRLFREMLLDATQGTTASAP
jgi:putative nucleotidyltransferase with HDIG domain